jgi:hypothetical protein
MNIDEGEQELQELVVRCLERMENEGDAALDAFCAEHAEHADAIRRRLQSLSQMGFLRPAAAAAFPERLGPFRLLERLGGGGMGIVYIAEQDPLKRRVALKLIRPEHLYFPGARDRFRREVEAVARLQHPGIVPIYTVGEEGGVPYFAMEHIAGASLADILRDLASEMFEQLKESRQTHWLAEAFSTLPVPVMSPRDAYQRLVRGQIEHVPLEDLANRVLATSIVPYPPGIPMLMPGEATGTADGPYLSYMRALGAWDRRFPGFGHDTHGVENRNGTYFVQCLKAVRRETSRFDKVDEDVLVGGIA